MKLLFVLSQVEVTGAETYALSLASALKDLGHEIVFVSDRLSQTAGFQFYPLPIHTQNTSTLGRIKNILALKKIIAREKIQLIHSHSRAANLVSHFASGSKIPMVVTVHGRWRNHFAFRVLPCLGNKTIAVCPYLKEYLIQDIGIPEQKVVMIPNGVDTNIFTPTPPPPPFSKGGAGGVKYPILLFVGRFSGQKGHVIRFLIRTIFPKMAQNFPNLTVEIVSSSIPEADQQMIRQFNERARREAIHTPPIPPFPQAGDSGFSPFVKGDEAPQEPRLICESDDAPIKGSAANPLNRGSWEAPQSPAQPRECEANAGRMRGINQSLLTAYSQSDVVIGSGRVAMEAMACGKPIVAIGESSAPGLVSEDNFEKAFHSNFGDCGEWNLFEKENTLEKDLHKILESSDLRQALGAWGRTKALEMFDSKKIGKQVEEIYKNLWIPANGKARPARAGLARE